MEVLLRLEVWASVDVAGSVTLGVMAAVVSDGGAARGTGLRGMAIAIGLAA